MREAGQVVEINGDTAHLRFNRTSACAKCGACGMLAGQDKVVITAKNTLGAQVGDMVETEFTSKNALQSTLIAYVFPLGMLILGVVLGYVIPQQAIRPVDILAAILGIAFGLGSFLILKLLNPVFQKKFGNVYTMVRIVTNDDMDEESAE